MSLWKPEKIFRMNWMFTEMKSQKQGFFGAKEEIPPILEFKKVCYSKQEGESKIFL